MSREIIPLGFSFAQTHFNRLMFENGRARLPDGNHGIWFDRFMWLHVIFLDQRSG
jgi:hypothetical protein